MFETIEECLKLAKEFLPTKERKKYYYFEAIDETYPEHVYYIQSIEDDELPALRALKEKYGEEFVKHLDEVFDDPDIIHDFTCGDELIDVDFDNVKHMYRFKTYTLKADETVCSSSCLLEFSDEEYTKLLAWHLYYKHTTINALRYLDRELYDCIWSKVDHEVAIEGSIMKDYPYTVTFDEVLADVESITRQHNIKLSEGYRCFF